MKKLRYLVSIWCILALLGVGAVLLVVSDKSAVASEDENRMLQAFPALTFESVSSGTFSGEFELFLSDKFMARDSAISFSAAAVNAFSLLSEEDQLQLVMQKETVDDVDKEADALPAAVEPQGTETSDAPQQTPLEAKAAETEPAGGDAAEEPAAAGQVTADTGKDTDPDGVTRLYLLGADGTKKTLYSYDKPRIREMAKIMNRLTRIVPEDGNVFFSIAPRGEDMLELYLYPDRYTGVDNESEKYLAAYVNDRVQIVSAADILGPHTHAGEYVYFRTDLHWTPLGAYYVFAEMLRQQGVPNVPYTDYGWRKQSRTFLGSTYGRERFDTTVLVGLADTVDNIIPVMPYEFYTVKYLTRLSRRMLIENRIGYKAYLGGNQGPWRMIQTDLNTGRRALVIADSMGTVFTPFLMSAYDQVHLLCPKGSGSYDLKLAGGTIKKFVDYYGIDDIYVVSGAFFGSESYRMYMSAYMGD